MRASTIFLLLLSTGCAGVAPQPLVAPTPRAEAEASPAALEAALAEAFHLYAAEVEAAAAVVCRSEAEAEALRASVGPVRFDLHLELALARRGLTLADLAGRAEADPRFAFTQQALHHGRLEGLLTRVAAIAPGAATDDGLRLTRR